ncbi:MAG TPA: thiol peroxidase [bacterium]|nr:thiol peroxidase [bacterium]HPJ71551.1 thiol peroxidase [bacterium]HPQ65839.1 thiol peroxidase [bacterium]
MDWWLKSYLDRGRFELPERAGVVTMKGRPLTLVGEELKPGMPAPGFRVVDNELNEVTMDQIKGEPMVITSVPSLDTPVCDIETRHFNRAAAEMGPKVKIYTISMDLPFAQKRWCGANGVKNLQTLSDYRDAWFGYRYGILIKELRLLARAVFVIDREGIARYCEVVGEVADEPDYDSALFALRGLVGY